MNTEQKKERIERLTKTIKRAMFEADTNTNKVATELKKKYNDDYISPQALSQKLKRGVLPYIEVEEIAEHLGYSIEWVKKQ